MKVITISDMTDNSINDTMREDLPASLCFSAIPLSEMYILYNMIPMMKSNTLVNGLT